MSEPPSTPQPVARAVQVTPSGSIKSGTRSLKRKISPDCVYASSSATTRIIFLADIDSNLRQNDPFVIGETPAKTISYYPEGKGRVYSSVPLYASSHAHIQRQSAHHTAHVVLPKPLKDFGNSWDALLKYVKLVFPPDCRPAVIWTPAGALELWFKKLPPKPWPISFGGFIALIKEIDPLKGIDHDDNPLFPGGRDGHWRDSTLEIIKDADYMTIFTQGQFEVVALRVYQYFIEYLPEYRVTNVMFGVNRRFMILLKDLDRCDFRRLPGMIAQTVVFYYDDSHLPRPHAKDLMVKRKKQPQPLEGSPKIDNTVYTKLRPGILIATTDLKSPEKAPKGSSDTESTISDLETFQQSTTGVLVYHKDEPSDFFMTGATHCMSKTAKEVFQPGKSQEDTWNKISQNKTENVIGAFRRGEKTSTEITGTDMCLVKLKKGLDFENIPFQNDDGHALPYLRLATPDDEGPGPNTAEKKMRLWMNSPFTGTMDGMFSAYGLAEEIMVCEEPDKDAKLQQRLRKVTGPDLMQDLSKKLVRTSWTFHGSDADTLRQVFRPGICGTAVADEEGIIRGFFHVYCSTGNFKGHSVSVGAEYLYILGYRLATNTARANSNPSSGIVSAARSMSGNTQDSRIVSESAVGGFNLPIRSSSGAQSRLTSTSSLGSSITAAGDSIAPGGIVFPNPLRSEPEDTERND